MTKKLLLSSVLCAAALVPSACVTINLPPQALMQPERAEAGSGYAEKVEVDEDDDVPITMFGNSAIINQLFTGVVRKDAKTSDPQVAPTAVTIQQILAWSEPSPAPKSSTPRVSGTPEAMDYTVEAWLHAYSYQNDHDFHLLLADTKTPTSTTPFVNVEVSGLPSLSSSSYKVILAGRTQFVNLFNIQSVTYGKYICITPVKVRVTGAGLWDSGHASPGRRIHTSACGTTWTAGTAWELHPVTEIQ